MTQEVYTVITFAPVQGFIEKSRKLRDLYGSSYLLSYLSWAICTAAKSNHCKVVSPALPNVTQGMPNQIIIRGDFKCEAAKSALDIAWKCVTETCRKWIEEQVKDGWEYKSWERIWGLWTKYAWEFFWVQGKPGETISDVRQRLNEEKRWRAWTGINWQGESSTLSGADAIAYPGLGRIADPRKYDYQAEKKAVERFYKQLSEIIGESFIDENEELSIPELIKRLITYQPIAEQVIKHLRQSFEANNISFERLDRQIKQLLKDLHPQSFKDLSRLNHKSHTLNPAEQQKKLSHQGWFQGDGDKAGDYLKGFAGKANEAIETKKFSTKMRNWGEDFKNHPPELCRVVYAGGDDFLGVFYDTGKEEKKLEPKHCVDCLSNFKTQVWHKNKGQPEEKPITVSVGFVWAAPGIPQRDILQHCREAEKSAKSNGRDRIAFRVLFNNGNYLEWVCPWWLLEQGLLSSYCDREEKQNWTHIYNDVAVLESRHAFNDQSTDIALGLLEIYFPKQISAGTKQKDYWRCLVEQKDNWFNDYDADKKLIKTGILGEEDNYKKDDTYDNTKINNALNDWIINLAKLGFHLCQ